jgi:hypothetical protein
MAKKSNRQALIETIMKNRYGDDDPKYDRTNLAFLESLSLAELTAMAEMDIDEDEEGIGEEFDLEGEIMDTDY